MSNDTKRVRILTETHEHAGVAVAKGTEIDLDPPTAEYLIHHGHAELVGAGQSTEETAATRAGAKGAKTGGAGAGIRNPAPQTNQEG